MSKLLMYGFGLLLLLLIAGFGFLAMSPVNIDQKEIKIIVENDASE